MPYDSTTGIVTKPIQVGPSRNDVGSALGVSSMDWGTLCRHNNVNWRSKYKPAENPNVKYEMTDAQYKEVNWGYRFSEGSVGLDKYRDYVVNGTIPPAWQFGDTENLRSIGFGWYYEKPSTRKRITDFHRYNSKTTSPLLSAIDAPSEVKSDTASMYIELYKSTFWLDDFRTFVDNNCHLGVMIIKQGTNTAYYKTIVSESGSTYQRITFNQSEVSQIFSGGAGDYNVYVFATADYAHNTLRGDEYYNATLSGITVWPLPVDKAVIKYSTSSSGTSDNIVNFHIDDLDSTSNTLTWSLRAYNTTSTAKEVQYVWFHISAVDEYGATWEMGAPELLQAGAFDINVPANDTADVGDFEERYEAYKNLSLPWTVTLSIYHSNDAAGTDRRGAGTAQFVYE